MTSDVLAITHVPSPKMNEAVRTFIDVQEIDLDRAARQHAEHRCVLERAGARSGSETDDPARESKSAAPAIQLVFVPMRRTLTIVVVLACALANSSCGETSPGTIGARGSTSSGASGTGDEGGTKEPEPVYVFDDGSGSGATWSDLYKDFFGPSGRASCAGTGSDCHGSSSSAGVSRSSFVCADKTACRESFLGKSNLVQSKDFASPENAFLVGVLRKKKADGSIGGTQPTSPLFVFHASSIDRIKTWISSGAAP